MTATRRHESVVPLSREHHHALLLCLRIHRGLQDRGSDPGWLRRQAHKTASFFNGDLIPHFQAEEEVLFPAMRGFSEAIPLIDELISEHAELKRFANELHSNEPGWLAIALKQFADLLEAHIRKEERRLFPIYEENASPEVMSRVESELLTRVGPGYEPRDPELLT